MSETLKYCLYPPEHDDHYPSARLQMLKDRKMKNGDNTHIQASVHLFCSKSKRVKYVETVTSDALNHFVIVEIRQGICEFYSIFVVFRKIEKK